LVKWMIVEDELDLYEVLMALLEVRNIEGEAFLDGEEAVAWIDDVDAGLIEDELPELALLDIRLPGDISGPMVGERLRQSPVLGERIAVILTTAYKLSLEDEKAAMEQSGADFLLPKPLPEFNKLKTILHNVVAERRHRLKQTFG
jgi:CheY-like chemotaxis protein